jgi:type I restriction enzyme S subunit
MLVPPLDEQRRIAAILDQADALRRARRRAIERLNDLGQAIFYEMFGDPVTNPKGWKEVSMGKVSDVQGGLQLSSKRKSHSIKMPYLRVANVYRDRLWLDEIKEIGLTENEAERTLLEKGDILIVEGHGNPEEIGRCAVWDDSIKGCVHQNHLIRVRLEPDRGIPHFVSTFLNTDGGSLRLKGESRTTSGLNTISVAKVRRTLIPLPPLSLQRRFAAIVEAVEQQTALMRTHLAELDTLFSCLQQRAFRGNL